MKITSTIGVGGYQVSIAFDKNIVRLADAGVTGGTGQGFTDRPTTVNINNTTGNVILNHYQADANLTGTFTVAKLAFTTAGVVTSALTLTVTSLADVSGNEIPRPPATVTLSSGTVTSNYVCTP